MQNGSCERVSRCFSAAATGLIFVKLTFGKERYDKSSRATSPKSSWINPDEVEIGKEGVGIVRKLFLLVARCRSCIPLVMHVLVATPCTCLCFCLSVLVCAGLCVPVACQERGSLRGPATNLSPGRILLFPSCDLSLSKPSIKMVDPPEPWKDLPRWVSAPICGWDSPLPFNFPGFDCDSDAAHSREGQARDSARSCRCICRSPKSSKNLGPPTRASCGAAPTLTVSVPASGHRAREQQNGMNTLPGSMAYRFGTKRQQDSKMQ